MSRSMGQGSRVLGQFETSGPILCWIEAAPVNRHRPKCCSCSLRASTLRSF